MQSTQAVKLIIATRVYLENTGRQLSLVSTMARYGKQTGKLTTLRDKQGEIGHGTLKILRHKRGIRDNRVRDIRSF